MKRGNTMDFKAYVCGRNTEGFSIEKIPKGKQTYIPNFGKHICIFKLRIQKNAYVTHFRNADGRD